MLHDGLVAMGLLALFDIEFDLNVIAGLMAVIGYSLNDSIVISDRLRDLLGSRTRMGIHECSGRGHQGHLQPHHDHLGHHPLHRGGPAPVRRRRPLRLLLHPVRRHPGGDALLHHGGLHVQELLGLSPGLPEKEEALAEAA